ncbi:MULTISPECIES: DUF5777 family beta-barrel protein [unclassified Aureispira]|uniref:DUF5777 family beta-barrel protein n=1 Tax=unclassified Aureispira TaxID=2649989 RepID=UPI0006961D88|nr:MULTISPECIES: DUF5777 family beta-barrel protein [unclassified Aureispira]WMX15308.1 DUF5777 family beta-barrel protein [Aureispira sp. CCB-E]
MKHLSTIVLAALTLILIAASSLQAQDKPQKEYVYQTFKDTRVINTYSIETLQKGILDFRVAHRFGDIFGRNANGNWNFENLWANFLGFESAADVGFGVEYGITNNFMIGFHRTKGSSELRSLLHLNAKYKFLAQTKDNSMPLSMAAAGVLTVSTMPPSADQTSLASFPGGFGHRMIYSLQLLMGRKFGDIFSLQLSPTLVWRNLVRAEDNNALVSMGVSAKVQVSKVIGIILDANVPFDKLRWTAGSGYHMPIGIGFEFDTGGHVFQINITNSAGIEPTDYIPNTNLNWADGEFRIGFTISRGFRM